MSDDSAALPPGSRAGPFTLGALISRAASCRFYRASDAGTGHHFLLSELISATGGDAPPDAAGAASDAAGVARFLAAGHRATTLRHPGIAPVARCFKANGTAYWVMSVPPGRTLAAARVSADPSQTPDSLPEPAPLLDALEYLHGEGIVHQGITPELVWLPDTGEAMLLLDGQFGGGRAAAAEPLANPAGSAYRAIEQQQSDGGLGPWTDIYGLAASLHFALTGEAPPDAAQRAAALQRGEPDPFGELQAGTSDSRQRELATLVNRGLILDPERRPQSVREWRARVQRAARTETDQVAVSPPVKERRDWLPAVLLGCILASILAIGTYLLLADRSTAPVPAQAPAAPASASAEESERWRQALEADAVITYREFIADYPGSIHLRDARLHIDRLEDQAWQSVLAESSRAGFEAHLERFPDGRHAAEALARIEAFREEEARLERQRQERLRQEVAAWEAARATGTAGALDDFLAAWPAGAHAGEARELRRQLQGDLNDGSSFEIAAREHTIAAYRSYIEAFPAGRHVRDAHAAIESLTLRIGRQFRDCDTCPLMIVVPAGAFWQGSADSSTTAISTEKPRRRVVIDKPFAVGVNEVTLVEWDACAAAGGCEAEPDDNGWGRGNRPVILVSWSDALQYANWLSGATGQQYSLPSESQWEYAARAGEEGDWAGGSAIDVCKFGNIAGAETGFEWRHTGCADRASAATLPVGSLRANAFGIHDVIGNVAEWTLDCMNLSYLDAPADGSAWSRGLCGSRITRGGSWFTGSRESRLPARFNLKTGDRNDFTGFRVVRRVEMP